MGLSWTALRLIPRWRGESVKVSVVCFYETEVNSKTVRPFTAQVSTPGDTPCVRKRLSPWNEPLLSPPAWPPCPRAAVPLGGWLESQWLLQCACHGAIMRFAEVIDPWFFIGLSPTVLSKRVLPRLPADQLPLFLQDDPFLLTAHQRVQARL